MIRAMEKANYHLSIRENGQEIDARPLHDPFIVTTVHVSGWRQAWEVLRGRHVLVLRVTGTDAAHRAVFDADYAPQPVTHHRDVMAPGVDRCASTEGAVLAPDATPPTEPLGGRGGPGDA